MASSASEAAGRGMVVLWPGRSIWRDQGASSTLWQAQHE
jgi:hypothetical protein